MSEYTNYYFVTNVIRNVVYSPVSPLRMYTSKGPLGTREFLVQKHPVVVSGVQLTTANFVRLVVCSLRKTGEPGLVVPGSNNCIVVCCIVGRGMELFKN